MVNSQNKNAHYSFMLMSFENRGDWRRLKVSYGGNFRSEISVIAV